MSESFTALEAAFTAQTAATDAAFAASGKAVSVAMSATEEALKLPHDWCIGCRDIKRSHSMRWTDAGWYLCSACVGEQPSYQLPVLGSSIVSSSSRPRLLGWPSLWNKEIDLDSDTIKVMLCTSGYAPNRDIIGCESWSN